MSLFPQNWSREWLKRRVRFAYGDSLASESRNDGNVPVFGSNGVVGVHNRSITCAPVIIIGRKGSAGKVTWSDVPCFPIDTTYFVDRTQTRENMRWLFYALESLELDKINFDSAVPGLSRELAYSLPLVFPPLHEQRRIAAYLDKTCAAIDTAIEKKQKQLETLDALRKSIIHKAITRGLDDSVELKDSGVEWIGRVSKHWRVEKLKRFLERPLMYGTNEAAELDDMEFPRYIRITDFDDNGSLRDDTFKSLPQDKAEGYFLIEGDVLFARSGATVGKTFLFKGYNGKACFAGYLIKAQTNIHKLLPEYLYYFTKSPSYDSWKSVIFTQATIQNISATKYACLPIVAPPTTEQRRILEYLDGKMDMLQVLQKNLSNQISALEQYRKSLIHECVTGKRRIE